MFTPVGGVATPRSDGLGGLRVVDIDEGDRIRGRQAVEGEEHRSRRGCTGTSQTESPAVTDTVGLKVPSRSQRSGEIDQLNFQPAEPLYLATSISKVTCDQSEELNERRSPWRERGEAGWTG